MILRTVASVLDQDWPHERLTVIVSDDGHDPQLQAALAGWPVIYHQPPPRWAPGRDGAAKAGNLNSALAAPQRRVPGARVCRDARCRRRARLERIPAPVSRTTRARPKARVRPDDQGGAGCAGRSVQQSRGDLLPKPDARPERRELGLSVRLGCCVARRGARRDRRLPDLEPRRRPAVRRRSAAPRLARALPANRRRRAAALATRRPELLQAARHVGARHHATDDLGKPARARAPPAAAVLRAALLLPRELHRPRVSRLARGRAARLRTARRGACRLHRTHGAARRCNRAVAVRPQPARTTTGARGSGAPTASCGR